MSTKHFLNKRTNMNDFKNQLNCLTSSDSCSANGCSAAHWPRDLLPGGRVHTPADATEALLCLVEASGVTAGVETWNLHWLQAGGLQLTVRGRRGCKRGEESHYPCLRGNRGAVSGKAMHLEIHETLKVDVFFFFASEIKTKSLLIQSWRIWWNAFLILCSMSVLLCARTGRRWQKQEICLRPTAFFFSFARSILQNR